MSSADIAEFFTHTVSVETYTGRTGAGVDGFATSADVQGLLTQKTQLVRNTDGEEVVSSSTFAAAATDADKLAPKSRVTLPGEDRPRVVLARAIAAGVTAIEGLDHVTVFLQ